MVQLSTRSSGRTTSLCEKMIAAHGRDNVRGQMVQLSKSSGGTKTAGTSLYENQEDDQTAAQIHVDVNEQKVFSKYAV